MKPRRSASAGLRPSVFIDGAWDTTERAEHYPVVNPATEEVIATFGLATEADADRAVVAARRAIAAWSETPVAERAAALRRLAAALEADRDALADTISAEMGTPRKVADMIHVGLAIYEVAEMAKIVERFAFEQQVRNSLVIREPIGVVAGITPWNFPLHQITAKLAPALAAGCTVVIKPSELAPLAAMRLADITAEIGLPPGVFNLVVGTGPVVGEALASHPDVDMVSFTGSTAAGRRVSVLASETVKRVALELGGKSANVILDDADLEQAVTTGVRRAFVNGGQTCSALTRMLVPRSNLAEAERIAAAVAGAYVAGDPFAPGTLLGPMVSATQRDRVVGYIKKGIAEGARLVAGGPTVPEGLDRGYFVQATVLSDVDPVATVAQEEIFGPVLSIIAYDDEDDAVAIANNSSYGLGGAVWSANDERARRVARRLRTGQVEVNGGAFNAIAPFGGYKASGNGREGGMFGLEEYLEIKSLQL